MKRIDYITKECFKNKVEYKKWLKLVEEEKRSNELQSYLKRSRKVLINNKLY